jgi:hypothetical protein
MMARKYSKASGKKVERAMHEMKQGKLRSGRSGPEGQKPQAGDRDRLIGSTKVRGKGAA